MLDSLAALLAEVAAIVHAPGRCAPAPRPETKVSGGRRVDCYCDVKFEHYDMPGADADGDIVTAGGAKAAWFKDSEGNILAVVQDL